MTKEEELQALRDENRTLKALVAEQLPLREQLAQANERIKDLEDTLAKDNRTSSKPPSSDDTALNLQSTLCFQENGESLSQLLGAGNHFTSSSVEKCGGGDKLRTYRARVLSYP